MAAPGVEQRRGRQGPFLTLLLTGLAACGMGVGSVPVVGLESNQAGFKMLLPGAEARECGTVLWPYGSRSGGTFLQTAAADLIAQNDEADTIRNLHVSWRGVDLLVAQIGCVSVRGDVGRSISTVSLPMLGDHGAHVHPAPSHPE